MSYILEALKKLEQKRRRDEGTLLLSDHQAGSVPKRQPPWFYLLVLALILNAGLILWWLRPWLPARSGKNTLHAASEISDAPEGRTLSGGRGKRRENADPRPLAEVPQINSVARVAEVPDQPAAPREKPQPAALTRSAEPAAPRAISAAHSERPIEVSQLPPGLKEGLPDLTISGHFFDAAASHRLVIIGGHTLREGQSVAPGLTLEQITRDGVVLNYRGTRFRKGVF